MAQVRGRLLLTTKDFNAALKHAGADAKKFNKELKRLSGTTAKKLIRDQNKITKNSLRSTKQMKEGWWKKFGAIALGFTIAYRAMNAFEAALSKVISVIGEAIRESGVLAETQAKLAFWYQLHSEEAIEFSEAFKRAAVNVEELRKASIRSISTLEELAIGIDEIAQTIGGIAPQSIAAMASVVDFTVMVAQTTGSTTRQIRQELQALMDGRIKTTDQLARSLMKVGILTTKDLKDLRDMKNQVEILDKVFRLLGERQRVVNEILLRSSVELALKFWEKSIRNVIIQSVKLASELKGVESIFAGTMARHAEEFMDKFSEKDMDRFVVLMNQLNWVLDKALGIFEEMIRGVGKLATGIDNLITSVSSLSPKIIALGKAFATLLIVKTIVPLVKALTLALGKMLIKMTVALAAVVTGVSGAFIVILGSLIALTAATNTAITLMGGDILINMKSLRAGLAVIWNSIAADVTTVFGSISDWLNREFLATAKLYERLGNLFYKFERTIKKYPFLENIPGIPPKEALNFIGDMLIGISNTYESLSKSGEAFKASFLNVKEILAETIEFWKPIFRDQLDYLKEVWGPQFAIELRRLIEGATKLAKPAVDELMRLLLLPFDPKLPRRFKDEFLIFEEMAGFGLKGLGVPPKKKRIDEEEELKRVVNLTKDAYKLYVKMLDVRRKADDVYYTRLHKYQEDVLTLYMDEREALIAIGEMRNLAARDFELMINRFDFDEFKNRYEDMRDGFADAVKTMTDYWMDFLKTGKFEFGNFITDVLAQIARLVIAKYLVDPLADAFGRIMGKVLSFGGDGGSGGGWTAPGAFPRAGAPGFAKGGVLPGPTYFPLANVIGGEAGREALLPLSRLSGGKLGVGVSGMFNVNIINNTGAEIEQSETTNRQGGRDLTVVIGMAMGQDVVDGGPLHQALRKTFALKTNLIGRS